MMNPRPDKATLEAWRKDPDNWKWGFFYYNKNDKRIFPPKKNPNMGVTINFANPKSILVFVLLIFIPLLIVSMIAIASAIK